MHLKKSYSPEIAAELSREVRSIKDDPFYEFSMDVAKGNGDYPTRKEQFMNKHGLSERDVTEMAHERYKKDAITEVVREKMLDMGWKPDKILDYDDNMDIYKLLNAALNLKSRQGQKISNADVEEAYDAVRHHLLHFYGVRSFEVEGHDENPILLMDFPEFNDFVSLTKEYTKTRKELRIDL